MNIRVEVVYMTAEGGQQRREVLSIEPRELAMETVGMNLNEGKALLAGVQDFVVAQQVHDIWSNGVCVPTATVGTPPKSPAAHPSTRFSVGSRCRIRDGTGARARRRARRRSARQGLG